MRGGRFLKFKVNEEYYFTPTEDSIDLVCVLSDTEEFVCTSSKCFSTGRDISFINCLKTLPTLFKGESEIMLGRLIADMSSMYKMAANQSNLLECVKTNRESFLTWYNQLLHKYQHSPITLQNLDSILEKSYSKVKLEDKMLDNWIDEEDHTLYVVFEDAVVLKTKVSYSFNRMAISLLNQMHHYLLLNNPDYDFSKRLECSSRYFPIFRDLINSYQADFIKSQLTQDAMDLVNLETDVVDSGKMSLDDFMMTLNDRGIISTDEDEEGKIYVEIEPVYLKLLFTNRGIKRLFEAFDYIRVPNGKSIVAIYPKVLNQPIKSWVDMGEFVDYLCSSSPTGEQVNIRICTTLSTFTVSVKKLDEM